ncbi:MAG TPA: pitrilysin family protein, partial [Holophaga sp.]|nr:pitrilysin family protein [Holophaga sp.]
MRMLATLMTAGMLVFSPVPAVPGTGAPKAKAVQGATVEGITEYRLSNGLRVLLFPDPGQPTITVNITYLVGSRHENYGETGMAHLLEHMLFKGTPRHPDIPGELTRRGARSNGQTSFDRTNYFETFQATEENLRWALELEADRMVHSYIGVDPRRAARILGTEMTVVRNEFESGENSPGGVLYKRLLAVAFDWHNYGNLPIGARSDIENVDVGRLSAFYRTYYQPDNAVLLVSGRIAEAKTLGLVREIFGRIPRPARALPRLYTLEPTQDGERQVVVRRQGDVQLVLAGYHVPSGSDPDFAPVSVLAQLLGDTPTGRLHKLLVESGKAVAAFGRPLQLR